MTKDLVLVPVALLTTPGLSASAKLTWMAAKLRSDAGRAGGRRPPVTTVLTRPTMLKGMAQLAATGWDPGQDEDSGATVPVPATLVMDPRLSIAARVLYGLLLLMPGFEHPCGRLTYAGLAELAHVSPNTVRSALRELAAAEWLQIERENRLAPVHYQLSFPGFDRQMTLLAGVQKRLERAEFRGEQLMREFLSLLVDSVNFEDEAEPGWLVNPRTDERLRFDRFYPPSVAWEFNGPQHYHPTARFSAAEVARQKERDYIKLGISVTRNVTVVIVEPEDLTLDEMQRKVGNLLPMSDTTGCGLVIDYLEAESKAYRRRVTHL